MESKRQKQLASDIQKIAASAVMQELQAYTEGAFVTISNVSLTPDLLIARIHISVLQKEKAEKILQNFQEEKSILRRIIGNKMKNKVRRIPDIEFFIDNSLEKVYEIERLLKDSAPHNEEE